MKTVEVTKSGCSRCIHQKICKYYDSYNNLFNSMEIPKELNNVESTKIICKDFDVERKTATKSFA